MNPPNSNVLNSSEYVKGYLVHRLQHTGMSWTIYFHTLTEFHVASDLIKVHSAGLTDCMYVYMERISEMLVTSTLTSETPQHAYLTQARRSHKNAMDGSR